MTLNSAFPPVSVCSGEIYFDFWVNSFELTKLKFLKVGFASFGENVLFRVVLGLYFVAFKFGPMWFLERESGVFFLLLPTQIQGELSHQSIFYILVICAFFKKIMFWFFLLQARELQTLHNLRKLFVQDLTTRVKKVKLCSFKPKSSPFFSVFLWFAGSLSCVQLQNGIMSFLVAVRIKIKTLVMFISF